MALADPYTDVGISRIAADVLKEGPLTTVDDNTRLGRFINRNYVLLRDKLQSDYPWAFLMARIEVTADVTDPVYGWAYRYAFPAEALRVFPIREDGEWSANLIPHEIEGRWILTDRGGPLPIRYILKNTTASTFPPEFAYSLAMFIAMHAADFLTGKQSAATRAAQLFAQAIAQADLVNTLSSGSPESQSRYDILDVRGYGATDTDGFR